MDAMPAPQAPAPEPFREFNPEDPATAKFHPMWPEQIALEQGMQDEGSKAYAAVVAKARHKQHMARLEPVRHLLMDWLPRVSEHVRMWVRAYSSTRGGPKPVALPLIQGVDPDLLATIVLRTVLDRITARATNILPLCIEIGKYVEHELRMREWEKHDRLDEKQRRKLAKELAAEGFEVPEDLLKKGSWRSLQDKLTREDSSSTHRRIVNSIMFNAQAEMGHQAAHAWRQWSAYEHFHVGSCLLDALTRGTGWFSLESDPNYVWKPGSKKGPALALMPKPEMLEWLSTALDRQQLSQPMYKPTRMPPRRWQGTREGGYWTPAARTPRLIRFKASQAQQRDGAADEYEALDMPEVYAALAFVQETGWAVNARVFHAAQICYDRGIKVNGMVSTAEISDIIQPEDIETNKDAREIWRKAQASVFRARHEQATKMWALERTITLADEFLGSTSMYFPHMLCFRGRMYPIPTNLQPQGNDLARGLMTFDTGYAVTEENGGAGWIAVQVASMWGHDKWDFDRRIAWVEEHNDLWLRIAEDPIAYREDGPEGHGWAGCDKPFQALAAILDWAGFLKEGFGYASCLPISVDGTCNGIQHLAAMTRDPVAGLYVNLIPGGEPNDIYRFIAEKLQVALDEIGLQRSE
jgi:DNA-directed RNA polymerase